MTTSETERPETPTMRTDQFISCSLAISLFCIALVLAFAIAWLGPQILSWLR